MQYELNKIIMQAYLSINKNKTPQTRIGIVGFLKALFCTESAF